MRSAVNTSIKPADLPEAENCRVVDTLTPKPLVLLDHKPIGPLANHQPMDIVAWESELDRLTNSSSSQGKMEYLVDGAQFFPRLMSRIQSARKSIDIRVYIFDNDHYALQIADLLRKRAEEIRVRIAVVSEEVWPPPASEEPQPPDPSRRIPFSDLIEGGKLDIKDVLQPIYDEINKKYGTNEKPGSGE